MMFSAGMGIGLIFWGVTEPLTHFVNPPPGLADSKAGTALATALFHWGFHPWSMYAVVGLSIAYGSYRMGRRQLISSSFIPLLGVKRVEGPIGKMIDILAIFATMFGTAASLGLGALQIGSGLRGCRLGRQGGHAATRDGGRGAHPRVRRLGGVRRLARYPVAVQHQHGARAGVGDLRVRRSGRRC